MLVRDLWACQMCGVPLRDGKSADDAAMVDHVRPYRLRPDLTFDPGNCRSVCRRCHARCDSIEKRHAGDAEAIAKAKLGWRMGTVDPYASW